MGNKKTDTVYYPIDWDVLEIKFNEWFYNNPKDENDYGIFNWFKNNVK